MSVADGTRLRLTSGAMNNTRLALIRPTAGARRGPRPRSWYEACVRHALRSYSNPRALRRNPLTETPGIAALAETCTSVNWNAEVAALRHAIGRSMEEVLESADEVDRRPLEVVLRGAMQGRTISAIAAELSYGREWLHRTWWPEAVRAVTSVMLKRYLRVSSEPADGEPALLRPVV